MLAQRMLRLGKLAGGGSCDGVMLIVWCCAQDSFVAHDGLGGEDTQVRVAWLNLHPFPSRVVNAGDVRRVGWSWPAWLLGVAGMCRLRLRTANRRG
jgi:hypothetical protein